MKRLLLLSFLILPWLPAQVWADPLTLDFSSMFGGRAPGNQGTLNIYGMTISAKTQINPNTGNPWIKGGAGGVAGDVYWGNLGSLDVTNGNYFGLGVLKNTDSVADSSTGSITYKEALVFDFIRPQAVKHQTLFGQTSYTTDLSFTLEGANTNYNTKKAILKPGSDGVRMFIKTEKGTVISLDVNSGAFYQGGANPDTYEWTNWISYALNNTGPIYGGEGISGLAVEQVYNNATNLPEFGVGTLTFEPVPEPSTLLLLSAGALGLAAKWKKFRATKQTAA